MHIRVRAKISSLINVLALVIALCERPKFHQFAPNKIKHLQFNSGGLRSGSESPRNADPLVSALVPIQRGHVGGFVP